MCAPTSAAKPLIEMPADTLRPAVGLTLDKHIAVTVMSVSSIIETPPPTTTTTKKTSPRPLPSCRALRLKTGTDLVKKQEVMKSGLEQPNRASFFPLSDPQHSMTPLLHGPTSPLPLNQR